MFTLVPFCASDLSAFVAAGMNPRQTYYYKVKSGSSDCEWSDVYSFRAPYADGVTRLASFGDMGHR